MTAEEPSFLGRPGPRLGVADSTSTDMPFVWELAATRNGVDDPSLFRGRPGPRFMTLSVAPCVPFACPSIVTDPLLGAAPFLGRPGPRVGDANDDTMPPLLVLFIGSQRPSCSFQVALAGGRPRGRANVPFAVGVAAVLGSLAGRSDPKVALRFLARLDEALVAAADATTRYPSTLPLAFRFASASSGCSNCRVVASGAQ